jgi:hypothetical protein
VATRADSRHEACSQVEPSRNAEAVPRLDSATPREEAIKPDFMLQFLLNLRTSDNRQRPREPQGDQHHRFFSAHRRTGA